MRWLLTLSCALALASVADAQNENTALPPNTIDCSQFQKVGSNAWMENGVAKFDLGSAKGVTLKETPILPGVNNVVGGVDLYQVLETKCGSH
jgi:hypothetical protein